MDKEKTRMLSKELNVAALFDADPAIAEMRSQYTTEFLETFKMGFLNYSEGEWVVARRLLLHTRNLLGRDDGPSSCLLRFMAAHKNQPPEKWKGVREMDSALTETSTPTQTLSAASPWKSTMVANPSSAVSNFNTAFDV